MRITKLHLLLFFLLAGAGIYGAYFWRERQARKVQDAERKVAEQMKIEEAPVAVAPPVQVSAPEPSPALPEKLEPNTQPMNYTVKKGDTLWKIAKMQEHFGQGHRWYDIWKANEDDIADFDRLPAGQTLLIPLDKPDGYRWPKTDEGRKNKILAQTTSKPETPSETEISAPSETETPAAN